MGSVEQHGPHLPLDADSRVATGFAERVAQRHGALVLPLVAFGVLHRFRTWPGSIGIPAATLTRMVAGIIEGALDLSRRVILLSGHDENHEALVEAARLATCECGADVVVVEWAALARDELVALSTTEYESHGGELLTSLLLAWDPSVVRMEHARTGRRDEGPMLADDLHVPARAYRAVIEPPSGGDGTFGMPGPASAALGEQVERAVLDAFDRLLGELGWAR